jgi:hypothetical protein
MNLEGEALISEGAYTHTGWRMQLRGQGDGITWVEDITPINDLLVHLEGKIQGTNATITDDGNHIVIQFVDKETKHESFIKILEHDGDRATLFRALEQALNVDLVSR